MVKIASNVNRCRVFSLIWKLAVISKNEACVSVLYASIAKLVEEWNLTVDEERLFLRSLKDLSSSSRCEFLPLFIKYLKTFNAAKSQSCPEHEVVECIVSAIHLPTFFTFDEFLEMNAVQSLAALPIHGLLSIFVRGSLADYLNFKNTNASFMEKLGLQTN